MLDWWGNLNVKCMLGDFRYSDKFFAAVLTPIVIIMLVLLVGQLIGPKLDSNDTPKELVAIRSSRAAMVLVFFVYPSVSQTIFQGISCVQLDQTEYWLASDLQTQCDEQGWSPMLVPCVIASFAIPIGMPIGLGFLLWSNRAALQTADSIMREKYSFFVQDYEHSYYYWECFEMARKCVLVGFISFLGRGTASQLVAGVMWQLCFMIAVTYARPFQLNFADCLKTACDCALLVTLVLSIVLKVDLETEMFNELAISWMMILANLRPPGQHCAQRERTPDTHDLTSMRANKVHTTNKPDDSHLFRANSDTV